ncbi:MAG: CoA-transferase [Sciscionella sp.]
MPWSVDEMRVRLAVDIPDGWIVNLGTGMPSALVSALRGRPVLVHSENGILGVGPLSADQEPDPDIVNAGKAAVVVVPGASFMDSLTSFCLIRGGYVDLSIMGAYQISSAGDIANWRVPPRRVAGVGGAADLCVGAKRIWVLMTHRSKDGASKLVERCDYPLTGSGVVERVYTDLGVFGVGTRGFEVADLAPGVGVDDLREATAAPIMQEVGHGVER